MFKNQRGVSRWGKRRTRRPHQSSNEFTFFLCCPRLMKKFERASRFLFDSKAFSILDFNKSRESQAADCIFLIPLTLTASASLNLRKYVVKLFFCRLGFFFIIQFAFIFFFCRFWGVFLSPLERKFFRPWTWGEGGGFNVSCSKDFFF